MEEIGREGGEHSQPTYMYLCHRDVREVVVEDIRRGSCSRADSGRSGGDKGERKKKEKEKEKARWGDEETKNKRTQKGGDDSRKTAKAPTINQSYGENGNSTHKPEVAIGLGVSASLGMCLVVSGPSITIYTREAVGTWQISSSQNFRTIRNRPAHTWRGTSVETSQSLKPFPANSSCLPPITESSHRSSALPRFS